MLGSSKPAEAENAYKVTTATCGTSYFYKFNLIRYLK